jgi:hypothetical protein
MQEKKIALNNSGGLTNIEISFGENKNRVKH